MTTLMDLSKSEKAVAVAKDIIAQLRKPSNKIRVLEGNGYLETGFVPDNLTGDLKDVLPKMLKEKCWVCARGAALISKARLFDNVPLKQIFKPDKYKYDEISCNVECEDTTRLLASVFSKGTLDRIEAAFETNPYISGGNPTKTMYGATIFGLKYDDPKKRLIAIMKNIIENNGEFVVSPATEEEYNAAEDSKWDKI